jgi:hypothetical protein
MARVRLRKLFTNEEIIDAIDNTENFGEAAKSLSELRETSVTRHMVRYWYRTLYEFTKENGEAYVGTTVADRHIRNQEVKLRNPTPDDDKGQSTTVDNSRIMIIPDQHAPYQHKDALAFLADVASILKPTRVVNLGDETDGHALSFHDSDPNLDAAGPELAQAREFMHALARMFPVQDVCHSNHGSLVYRRAFKTGIPVEYIRPYREVLFPDGGGEGWEWKEQIDVTLPNGDRVIFQHQSAGDILNNAAHERANIVQGHEHGYFFIRYRSSSSALYWAMVSGCLIDRKALAFAYGKNFPNKPVIGCSAIIDSEPVLIPMPMDDNGRYTGNLNGVLSLMKGGKS